MNSPTYQIAARSLKDGTKERNGDALGHTLAGNGRLVSAMVADGVGSSARDWLASSTACQRFTALLPEAANLDSDPAAAMEAVLRQIDWEINSSTGRARGMKCAATAILWALGQSKVWFANIGDTRLYLADVDGMRQVSEDESQAVVRRGSGGKPLTSGGMVVVQRGITNALGSGNAHIAIDSCELPEGAALILCSDGFYECASSFEQDLLRVFAHADVEEGLASLVANYEGQNRDDATVLLLRRAHHPLADAELDKILAATTPCGVPLHAVAAAIGERLPSLVAPGDVGKVRQLLEYLQSHGTALSRTRAAELLGLMTAQRWTDRATARIVQSMIPRSNR
jgi:protein phosphatase